MTQNSGFDRNAFKLLGESAEDKSAQFDELNNAIESNHQEVRISSDAKKLKMAADRAAMDEKLEKMWTPTEVGIDPGLNLNQAAAVTVGSARFVDHLNQLPFSAYAASQLERVPEDDIREAFGYEQFTKELRNKRTSIQESHLKGELTREEAMAQMDQIDTLEKSVEAPSSEIYAKLGDTRIIEQFGHYKHAPEKRHD